MTKADFYGDATITLVTDLGYVLTGRVRNATIRTEPQYDSVEYDLWDNSFKAMERTFVEAEFVFVDGAAYTIKQNFVEVVKTLVVKGNMSDRSSGFAYSLGVPDGAIFKTYYSAKKNETTFKWTERVMMSD